MKIFALDLGDVWTGSALSDPLGITARPYKTVLSTQLIPFLQEAIAQEEITDIVIGLPKTMQGKHSEQTNKVIAQKQELERLFPDIKWHFWDERLSSKQAAQTKKARTPQDKRTAHSIAAAIILTGYLLFAAQKNSTLSE